MFEKLTAFFLKYRVIILVVFAVIFAVSVVGTVYLVNDDDKVNSDMMSYLSDDFDTTAGLKFIQSHFGIRGDGMLVVRGEEDDEYIRQAVANIRKMEGVRQLIWVEDAVTLEEMNEELKKLDIDLGDTDLDALRENMENNSLLSGFVQYLDLLGIKDISIDTSALKEYLKRPIEGAEGEYDYVIMIMMNYAPSTGEAYDLLDAIKAEFSDRSIASAGMTETAQTVMNDTLNDLPNFLIYAVIAVIVIMLLTTSSFVEPLIIMLTLGVSIVISMGANYLYPSISIISFATSAVLQLAITMDYSIFYMHVYKKNRRELDPAQATVKAVPEVASSILASGLTTIGGFVALYFMRFGVGSDLAGVLIKGVVLSLITILILQPVITMLLDKAIVKTTHDFTSRFNDLVRKKKPSFKGLSTENVVRPLAKFSVWQRIVLVVLAVALLVPAYIGQSKLTYSYFRMYETVLDTPEKVLADELGNQMIMAVPLKTANGTQKDFMAEVLADPNKKVSGIVGAFTAIDIDTATLISMLDLLSSEESIDRLESNLKLLASPEAQEILENVGMDLSNIDFSKLENLDLSEMLKGVDLTMLNSYFAKVDGEWYTMYSISIAGNTEDDAAMATYEYLQGVREKYFGSNGYSIGMLTGSYDMREVTPVDFLRVTLVSVAIIFIIIAILLKNPLKSFLLVLMIELGIWISLSLTFLAGQEMNFIIYIVISSVQLGCTVDYAILLANTFEHNRDKYTSSKECAIQSACEAVPAVFVSAALIIAVCMSVYFVSQNLIIKQLTGMLARGAAISLVLVTFVQTAIMSFFKTERKKTDFEGKIRNLEEKIKENVNSKGKKGDKESPLESDINTPDLGKSTK